MKNYKANIKILGTDHLALLGREPVIFHCNHYNLFLQRTIEDAGTYIDSERILVDGGAFVAYSMLQSIFVHHHDIRSSEERLGIASSIYSMLGFGLLPLSGLTDEGGVVTTPVTHYSVGWLRKWGKRDRPVDYFTCGYIQAAAAIAFYKPPGYFHVQQKKCLSMGDDTNEFSVSVRDRLYGLPLSPGVGVLSNSFSDAKSVSSNINEKEIVDALRTMPIHGNEQGLIPAFGVMLTRHFANYYNYISYETERAISKAVSEEGLAADLFVEAGHVCGFNTFGGIMKSEEWNGLVKPMCKNREDWLVGVTACLNALGWGHWTVTELVPGESMTMRVDGGYEGNGFLGFSIYDNANAPKSFLATGVAAAFMNLLYHGDILEGPELDEPYYEKLFRSEESFVGRQTKCRCMGNDYTEIRVEKQKFG